MKNRRKGFTLIEVMIAAAISTILLFGVFAILQVSNKQLETIHAKMTIQENLREALFKMAQEIRQTTVSSQPLNFGVGNSLSGSEINFAVPVPAPDESTLVDQNYLPSWAADINYSLSGDTHQILRTSTDRGTGVATQAVLANNIEELTFSRPNINSRLITITASAMQELADGRLIPGEAIHLTTQAEARNNT
jgi:prepilin-type N-terminal cleavage/methylation domain-containing protein